MKRLWKYLRSFDLAILLMCCLGVLCLAGMFFPQKPDAGLLGALGLNTLFPSPVLYAVLGLMVLNLGLCCAYKAAHLVRSRTPARSPMWGALIFHAGLAFIFVCGLFTRLGRFEGAVELTEGQTADVAGLQLKLEKLEAFTDYWVRERDYASHVAIGGAVRAKVEPNAPISHGGFLIYQSRDFGKSLVFRYGETVGSVNLRLLREGLDPIIDLTVPGTGIEVKGTLNKSNTAHVLVLESGAKTFEGDVSPGGEIKLAGGALAFLEVRGWSELLIVSDPAVAPLFASLAAGLLGLIWMLIPMRGRPRIGVRSSQSTVHSPLCATPSSTRS